MRCDNQPFITSERWYLELASQTAQGTNQQVFALSRAFFGLTYDHL